MKSIFDSLGLEGDRLRLSWISASEGIKYAQVVTDFSTCIRSKGSNTAGIEVFL